MKEIVKKIKEMKEKRVGSDTERVAGESEVMGKCVRSKMLGKRRSRYGSSIKFRKGKKIIHLKIRNVEEKKGVKLK